MKAIVLALVLLAGIVSAQQDGCLAPGTESCFKCLAARDKFGVKCRFDSKALECYSSSATVSSPSTRKWVEYSNDCTGLKIGKPRLTTGPANPTPATPTTPTTPTPATPTTPAAAATPSFTFDVAAAMKACNTHFYRDANGKPVVNPVILRVGCKFVATATVPAGTADVQITALLASQAFGPSTTGITSKATKKSDGVFEVEVTLGDVAALKTPVGEYKLYLVDAKNTKLFTYPSNMVLVFNPYMVGSPTYIADEPMRKDLIENEAGAMWVGSGDKPQWSPWAFDQFDFNVWKVVLRIVSNFSPASAADPTKLTHELAAKISTDVLTGKWGDSGYDDADTPPWQWSSSSAIYKVVNEKNRPAKYGQCMIFSMTTASAARAIGIAAQSHTGYDFVQERGGDLTVRVFWKPDGKGGYVWDTPANDKNGEKLWNFHAWTVIHIARADLGADGKAVGPNILDGTWRAGPGRLVDFKAQKLSANFDLAAYNPSINSKVIYMNQDPKVPTKYLEWVDPFIPANKIYTTMIERPNGCRRTVDSDGSYSAVCWEDAVTQYKATVRQPQNRPAASFRQMFSNSIRTKNRLRLTKGERERTSTNVAKLVSYMPLSTRLGNSFSASLETKALDAPKIAKIVGSIKLQTYDGQTLGELVSGSGTNSLRLEVTTAQFGMLKKREQIAAASFAVAHFSAYDAADNLVLFEERKMVLEAPKLNMLCGSKLVEVGQKLSCNINFYNPLPFDLEVSLDLKISGNTDVNFKAQTKKVSAKAGPDAQKYRVFFENVQYTTTTPGEHMVVASLKSKYLNEVKGATTIMVKPKAGPAVASTTSPTGPKPKAPKAKPGKA